MKRYRLILWILITATLVCMVAGAFILNAGSPDGITEIRNEEELLQFLENSDNEPHIRAVLTEDITLNTYFEPCDFYGTLDGCGHTLIIGNNRVERLIATVSDGSSVTNLNVKGMIGCSETVNAAGICDYNRGTIGNCCVSANFSAVTDASGICRRNAGYIRNCAVLGTSFVAGDGRFAWYPITGESTGTVDNCFYLSDAAAGYDGKYGIGLTAKECTDGTLAAKLESYANDHAGFVSWHRGSDGFPVLLLRLTGATASVFSNGTEMFLFLCVIALFTVTVIYSLYFFDKRKKFDCRRGVSA